MRITLTSVLVDDQAKALDFYTARARLRDRRRRARSASAPGSPWSARTARDGVELLLEPDAHPAAGPFKEALVADGIPFTAFTVDDVEAEHARLTAAGVVFTQPPDADGTGDHRGASTTPAAT